MPEVGVEPSEHPGKVEVTVFVRFYIQEYGDIDLLKSIKRRVRMEGGSIEPLPMPMLRSKSGWFMFNFMPTHLSTDASDTSSEEE